MVYVLLGTGFEEVEAITPVDLLRRANIPVLTVGVSGKTVTGSHGIPVVADITLDELDLTDLEMIVLPGGLKGVASLRASSAALDAVRFAWENGKFVAAICAAPTILAELHIPDGREAVCYPGFESAMGSASVVQKPCVRSGNLITGASAGCAVPFALALIEALRDAACASHVAQQIVLR